MRLHGDAVTFGHTLGHDAQVQVPHAVQHGFVQAGVVLDPHAGILRRELVQGLGELVFVAAPLGLDGDAEHRRRVGHGLQVEVVLVVGVVQHRVEVQLVELGHGTDVARHGERDFGVLLALHPEQVRDLHGLAAVADEQLGAAADRALVHPEQPELADERVHDDLEHVGDRMTARIRGHGDAFRRVALTLHEGRRVAFGRVRHQARDGLEQFRDAGAGFRGNEADGHEVALAQRLLEGIVQLLGLEFLALLEVQGHEVVVHLDHLVDDPGVGFLDRRKVGRLALIMEKTVDDLRSAGGRQVDRQAFTAELLADLFQHRFDICLARVDLVDDDDPAQAAVAGGVHHALRHRFYAGNRAHDDGRSLHRLQHRQGAADEIGETGRVDQVDMGLAGFEPADRGVDRMLQAARLRIMVRYGRAADQVSLGAGGPGREQKRLSQQGFSRPGVSHQGQVSEVAGCLRHAVPRLSCAGRFFKKNSTAGPRWLAPLRLDGQTPKT